MIQQPSRAKLIAHHARMNGESALSSLHSKQGFWANFALSRLSRTLATRVLQAKATAEDTLLLHMFHCLCACAQFKVPYKW